MITQISFII